jgi:hypothetical protein
MQIFKSLPLQNDLGVSSSYSMGASNTESEGISGVRPVHQAVRGLSGRVCVPLCRRQRPAGAAHGQSESLPGPLPYHDAEGNPLWTFTHATYTKIGGRIIGSGALDPIDRQAERS